MSRPCSCGGENQNCYKCGGWGLLDEIGAGRGSPDSIYRVVGVKAKAKVVVRCQYCHASVRHLQKHLRKVHEVDTQPAKANSQKQSTEKNVSRTEQQQVVRPRDSAPATSRRTDQAPLLNAHFIGAKPEMVRCPICYCGIRGDRLDKHKRKAHRIDLEVELSTDKRPAQSSTSNEVEQLRLPPTIAAGLREPTAVESRAGRYVPPWEGR